MLSEQNYNFPQTASVKLSKQIALKLSKGQIITKQVYKTASSQMEDNDLYNALFRDIEFYTSMYVHMGWNLVFCAEGEFFYLSKAQEDHLIEEGDSYSLRVCLPLFFMLQSTVKRGFDQNSLWMTNVGVSLDDIELLKGMERESAILGAVGYKGDVWQDAIKNLKLRGFVFENSKGNIVFSSAAKYFTEVMVDKYAD